MRYNRRTVLSAIMMATGTTAAWAQGRGGPCTLGYELSYGISALDCVHCTIRSDGNEHWTEYGAEPVVRGVMRAINPIQPGDVLVAIDGKLITTAAGGRALSHPVAGQAAKFTVRRAGRQVDVDLMPGTPCPIVSPATAAYLASSAARADSMNRTMSPAAKDSLHLRLIESMARMKALPDTFELRYERDAFGRTFHITYLGDSARFGDIGTSNMLFQPEGRGLFLTDSVGARKFRELNPGRGGTLRWKFMRADTFPDGMVRSIWNGGRDTNFALRAGRGVGGDGGRGRGTRLDSMGDALALLKRPMWSPESNAFRGRLTYVPDSSDPSRLRLRYEFPRDSLPYSAVTREYLLLNRNARGQWLAKTNGWLGFGVECHACSVKVDSTGTTRTWVFDSFPTVMGIDAGGPADAAGLHAGDVLRSIDGISILTAAGAARFGMLKPGDRAHFTVERNGKLVDLTLTVAKVRSAPS